MRKLSSARGRSEAYAGLSKEEIVIVETAANFLMTSK